MELNEDKFCMKQESYILRKGRWISGTKEGKWDSPNKKEIQKIYSQIYNISLKLDASLTIASSLYTDTIEKESFFVLLYTINDEILDALVKMILEVSCLINQPLTENYKDSSKARTYSQSLIGKIGIVIATICNINTLIFLHTISPIDIIRKYDSIKVEVHNLFFSMFNIGAEIRNIFSNDK
uniref:Uncharacterized protein n=1 Tax=Pithovirus LCDPAC01 TaxID=2506600 RepID=A0A4D5XFM2_9VIRU|nr:MAG: hypothetical protein LCDPAC01_02630 [Pithovirus LCDPAC01]